MTKNQFQNYIPREDFQGTALEWLKQEYARQQRLRVKTYERMKFIPNPSDMTKDKMIADYPFELPAN